jgi:hypothetical protein
MFAKTKEGHLNQYSLQQLAVPAGMSIFQGVAALQPLLIDLISLEGSL